MVLKVIFLFTFLKIEIVFKQNSFSNSTVAEVQLVANEFNISSTLTFKQLSIDDPLIIHGRIIGLPPGKF